MIKNIFIHLLRLYVHLFCRIQDRTLVFTSNPDYADNSRALSEHLARNGYLVDFRIVWLVRNADKCRQLYQDGRILFLQLDETGFPQIKDLLLCMTAGYSLYTHRPAVDRYLAHPKQKIIQLWHGCSYKDKDSGIGRVPATFDYGLVSGPAFVEPKASFFYAPVNRMLSVGFPRYDWLLHPSDAAKTFYQNVKQGNRKLVIWMPTFRNDSKGRFNSYDEVASFPLMPDYANWETLDSICRNNQVMLVIKLHMFQLSYDIDFSKFTNISILSNEDFVEAGVVMYEFLATTDALISDYSSVAVDYLVVNKPIAFALDDYTAYADKRGFIFKEHTLDFMPGHHLFDSQSLHTFIDDVANERDPYVEARRQMIGKTITLSSHYCQDLLSAIGL